MHAIFVETQRERHAGAAERRGEEEGVFDGHGVVGDRVPDESGRGVGPDL
jgi:hypothetical protein